jgi:uncharacterized protein (TIGR02466 family)
VRHEDHLLMSQDILATITDMAKNGQVEHMFSTPIFRYVFKDVDALNAALRDLILERERTVPSVSKSNQGGWQSPSDFFSWPVPEVATLEQLAVGSLKVATARAPIPPNLRVEFDLSGWAAVNRKGDYNTTHVHPGATWSGVYYIDAGDEAADAPGAVLEFSHPVTAALMTFFPGVLPSARVVRPENGMIILFPSYLQHSVRMYNGERPRVCVPFNGRLRSLRAQM